MIGVGLFLVRQCQLYRLFPGSDRGQINRERMAAWHDEHVRRFG